MPRDWTMLKSLGTASPTAAFAVILAVALAGLTACAPATRAPAPPASPSAETVPPAPASVPLAIQWVNDSAERRAILLQTFRAATASLDTLARGRTPGTWAIIADADETILDNSPYEVRRAVEGMGFSEASWTDWVREEAAPALPGAQAFLQRVHTLGGRVIVVTNRRDALCDATRANLAKDGLDADLVLCRLGTEDKNPRFHAVQDGTASAELPPLKVVMWLGDNIRDFPQMSQSVKDRPDTAFESFGSIYFVMPNPMYGSWQTSG